jgi:hypothetical protein
MVSQFNTIVEEKRQNRVKMASKQYEIEKNKEIMEHVFASIGKKDSL